MKKRQKARYQKEVDKCVEKHIKLLTHHLGLVFQRYSTEIWKINKKYFKLNEKDERFEEFILKLKDPKNIKRNFAPKTYIITEEELNKLTGQGIKNQKGGRK